MVKWRAERFSNEFFLEEFLQVLFTIRDISKFKNCLRREL